MQAMAHELEQESLLRDSQIERQVKALEAAAAEQQRKLQEDLTSKGQQIADLQVGQNANCKSSPRKPVQFGRLLSETGVEIGQDLPPW